MPPHFPTKISSFLCLKSMKAKYFIPAYSCLYKFEQKKEMALQEMSPASLNFVLFIFRRVKTKGKVTKSDIPKYLLTIQKSQRFRKKYG